MITLKLIEDWLAGVEEDDELMEDDLLELAAEEIRSMYETVRELAALLERTRKTLEPGFPVLDTRSDDELRIDIDTVLLRLEQGGILR